MHGWCFLQKIEAYNKIQDYIERKHWFVTRMAQTFTELWQICSYNVQILLTYPLSNPGNDTSKWACFYIDKT